MKRYKNQHGAVTAFHDRNKYIVQVAKGGGTFIEEAHTTGHAAMRSYRYWRERLQRGIHEKC